MKLQSLTSNYLFLRAYRSKNSYVSPMLVTYLVPKKRGGICLGITTNKKLGCAVERNRARRIVRAAATELLKDTKKNYDVVVVCRHAILNKKSTDVKKVLRDHLTQAGVLEDVQCIAQ